ncbi:hypothetical protein [Kitasatospora sp. NPDC057500]|uniref:hypothetical protein n=1 Tax=Kitasatospora sp. NPDC057500 TaxID=3346151 RepID=UPI003681C20C
MAQAHGQAHGREHGGGTGAGPGWFLTGPLLTAAGTVAGTALTASVWNERCPSGVEPPHRFALAVITMPAVWFTMTVALVLLQLPLRRAPAGVRWCFLGGTAVLLTALYVVGMGRPPSVPPDDCHESWPLFPFAG